MEGKSGKVPSIYILTFENQQRFDEIEKALEIAGWVSEVVVDFQTSGTGRLYAALVLNGDNKPTHTCRLVRRQTAGLNRRSVGISELESLTIEHSQLLEPLISDLWKRRRGDSSIEMSGRLTPSENQILIKELDDNSPFVADVLRKKGRTDDRILAAYTPQEREIIGLERDALGLAFEIAFDDRDQVTVVSSLRKHEAFLSMLSDQPLTEDEIILHEKNQFPGLARLRGSNPKFAEFEHYGSKLRIIHANRTSLERTLGVDLIYISEYFHSFVGVQYKMMEGTRDNSYFRRDSGFKKQLKTMKSLWSQMSNFASGINQRDYRLNSIPFYFKFVARLETNFADNALCPGLYLPFDLVSQIEESEPRERISRRDKTRHLSNTEFSGLVREGWIGATISQARMIESLVEEALTHQHSVTVGIETSLQRTGERRRSY